MHVVFESGSTLQAWNQLETKDHPAFLHITWIWLHSLSLGLTEEEEAQVAGNNELMEEEISGEKRPREDHRPSQRNTVFKHFYLAQPEAKCSWSQASLANSGKESQARYFWISHTSLFKPPCSCRKTRRKFPPGSWWKRAQGLAQLTTLMPPKSPADSSAPPSFSTTSIPDGQQLENGQLSIKNQCCVCVLGPASRGTQGMPKPRECFKHSRPLASNQAANPPPNPEGTPVPSAWHEASWGGETLVPRKHPKIFCLLAVGSSQDTISSISEPAHFEPWSCNLLEPQSCTCGQKGLWRPRVDIGSNSRSWDFFLSLGDSALPRASILWPICRLGLHPLLSGKTKKCPSMWAISLLKSFRAWRPCLAVSTLFSRLVMWFQPSSIFI